MSKRESERASVGRKQLYLHEAYLGSRLQNNGRKRVHGTFPCERACVPLIQGSSGPAPPCGQQRRHSLQGRRGWLTTGQGRVGGCRSTLLTIKSSAQTSPLAFLLLKQRTCMLIFFPNSAHCSLKSIVAQSSLSAEVILRHFAPRSSRGLFQTSSCRAEQTLFEDKGKLLTEIAKPFFNCSPLLFSCHFSPPFSQNNRDNNYLNLNYEYKGKERRKWLLCSQLKRYRKIRRGARC